MTNPISTELLRTAILRQLAAAHPASLTPDTLSLGLHTLGFFPSDALPSELTYLVERGFVTEVFKTLTPSLTRYRITPLGIDTLAKENLL